MLARHETRNRWVKTYCRISANISDINQGDLVVALMVVLMRCIPIEPLRLNRSLSRFPSRYAGVEKLRQDDMGSGHNADTVNME